MPVRNGAAHIAEAIDSLLAQTHREIDLAVFDNASTDRTPAIVEAIAASDSRVRLIRHERDIGGAANFIAAAAAATGEYFCWAAHDDLRDPEFLRSMIRLLEQHADAGLACCEVRNIDPDGTLRDVRPETADLRTTTGMSAALRLRMYLRAAPGTPFYGLFRTSAIRDSIDLLRTLDEAGGPQRPAILGIDMIFLADFIRCHGIAHAREPLLLFRRGGVSHDFGRYGSLREYRRQVAQMNRLMKQAVRIPEASLIERLQVDHARRIFMTRWLISRDTRRMTRHYLGRSLPLAATLTRPWRVGFDPALRRLRRRLSTEPDGCRIVLFGAGKHTRRRLNDLHRAVRGCGVIVAACDDHTSKREPIAGLPIVSPQELVTLDPDLIVVSSDTYEESMYARARAIAPRTAAVWCLYDRSLEISECMAGPIGESTDAMNATISSRVSPAISR